MMRIAVVTPYSRETDEQLKRAHGSVRAQDFPATHIMVADGASRSTLEGRQIEHIVLQNRHRDGGCTPRAAGAISAFARGFDAVAFLDADNCYEVDHLSSLVDTAMRRGAALVFSDRKIELPDGTKCPFEDRDVVERKHADTSCHFLTKRAAFLTAAWGEMGSLWPICDRLIMAIARRRALPIAWTGRRTVKYTSRWGLHHKAVGKSAPSDEHQLDWESIKRRFERGELPLRGFLISRDDVRTVLNSLHADVNPDADDFLGRIVAVS